MLDAVQRRHTKAAQAPRPTPAPDVPQTRDELAALAAKRSELIEQLESVTERREEVADQLGEADAAARAGLQSRLQTLDERSAQLEREIAHSDEAMAAAVASGIGIDEGGGQGTTVEVREVGLVSPDVMATAMFLEALAFVLLGVVLYRWMRKRARAMAGQAAPAESGRLEQLQHSIDAIAVEVERISEGQRYVTKALNDGFQPPVGAGAGQEAPVRRKST